MASAGHTTRKHAVRMTFAEPKILYLLLLIPLLLIYYLWRGRKGHATLRLPSLALLSGKQSWRVYLRHLPKLLRLTVVALIIVALARPQTELSWDSSEVEGIDIVLSFDISSSMLEEDFEPNRLEVAKRVSQVFVSSRPNDNIGLVLFSGESCTVVPLTTEHSALINRLQILEPGIVEDGTAIGLGLVMAINRLRSSQAKSKVIVLLTDGENNSGSISPDMAANIAKELGITVYAIGMGQEKQEISEDSDDYWSLMRFASGVDREQLESIASKTGGKYFNAADEQVLNNVFHEIDKLEKTKMKTVNYRQYSEEYVVFLLYALLALLLEFLLRNTLLRTNP